MESHELYTELYPTYAPKFERIGYNFETELDRAYHTATKLRGASDYTDIKTEVVSILKYLLSAYKPKKKSGKIFKVISGFLLRIIPFIKFKK